MYAFSLNWSSLSDPPHQGAGEEITMFCLPLTCWEIWVELIGGGIINNVDFAEQRIRTLCGGADRSPSSGVQSFGVARGNCLMYAPPPPNSSIEE